MNRRTFLRTGIGTGLSLSFGQKYIGNSYAETDRKPDVLFIAIEDLSPHRLSTYGNPVCRTPAIDRFADESLRFDAAYCSGPVCNPSRSSMLSGLRPETTGILGNNYDWRKILKPGTTLPEHFEQHGYETIRVGKMFHGGGLTYAPGKRVLFHDDERWSRVIEPGTDLPPIQRTRRQLKGEHDLVRENNELLAQGKPKRAFPVLYGPSGLADWEEKDGRVAEQAVRILSRESEKPLFLAVGFTRTHLAFTAPDKYFDLYPADKIQLPQNPHGDDFDTSRPSKQSHRQLLQDENQLREVIAAQYAAASFVDAQIGRVLTALELSGRAENTIVIIWSDHGFQLGEHFLLRKNVHYEHSTRVILMMKAPGITQAGTVCRRPVESIDLFPTLCDLGGLPIPPYIEGISMKPLLLDPSRSWKKGALISNENARTIRTERWRYTEYTNPRGLVELYDHHTDPGEFTNLADHADYREAKTRLHELLMGGWKACLPESSY